MSLVLWAVVSIAAIEFARRWVSKMSKASFMLERARKKRAARDSRPQLWTTDPSLQKRLALIDLSKKKFILQGTFLATCIRYKQYSVLKN
jgi:hypothetical protein